MSQEPTQNSATTQIKLLVNTASEAVNVIRERYGEMARVLSVKQVEVGGLKRLVSKPRLEVIVEITKQAESKAEPKQESAPKSAPEPKPATEKIEPARSQKEDTKPKPAETPKAKSALGNMYAKSQPASGGSSNSYFSQFEEEAPAKQPEPESHPEPKAEAPLGSAANPVKQGTLDAVRRAVSMLESVGFDRSLIERVRSEVDFQDIGTLPTMDLYAKICDWLRNHFPNTQNQTIGSRRAFVGCSGVGKTSALCKMLSAEVFIKGNTPTVLKIDSELPNPSDGLEVFCDIMGVRLARAANEVEAISDEQPLLVDLPGFSLSDPNSIQDCREKLDALGIDERVLVVNAAYEAELIADMLAAGESVGANKVVFTHLEETRKAGKLWKFLLNRRMETLFFSEGPNPAGEYTMDTYSYLLERSFPNGRELAAATRRSKPATETIAKEAAFRS